jgi:polyferredoxin
MERRRNDPSQRIRLGVQIAFIALNVWIGVQFFAWVRWIETGAGPAVTRPPGVEGWLPIAGLMNLKSWLATGVVPAIHPAAMVLLIAFLAVSVVLKKAFCGWLCPIGTLSELLWKLGRKIARTNAALPRWADLPLRSLKYLILGFFAWAIVRMPAEAIAEFMRAPYGVIADVKMLNFFRFLSTTALVVIAVLLALSVVVQNFWCRYLCPYGALLGLAALVSPTRIRRDEDACIDCGKCTKACPARLPVATLPQVRSAECTLCMSCVAVCPVKDALDAKVTRTRRLPAWAIAAAIGGLFAVPVMVAKMTGHWSTDIPDEMIRYFLTLM